jgi:predicted RNA-binding protein YlxR (DUF448 family)
MTRRGHIPYRMCIGCGTRKPKKELIRLVLQNGCTITLDTTGKLPGRGAYVCPASSCVRQAQKRKAFTRAFRYQGEIFGIDKIIEILDKSSGNDDDRGTG